MTLAIGDVQGCAQALHTLLARAGRSDDEPVWWVGDLVNRGPDSLNTLRHIRALGARATVVLGNHDLHLLGLATQARRPHRLDTLTPVLTAPDLPELIDWLRHRPLVHLEHGYLLVHAGLFPSWTAAQARALAAEVEQVLQGPDWVDFLRVMYGNTPNYWHDSLRGDDRLRAIINGLTRIRYLNAQGQMDFDCTQAPAHAPSGLIPWFAAPTRQSTDVTIVFGHWSSLGLYQAPQLIGLDTGCVWGGALSAIRLEDRRLFQVSCTDVGCRGGKGVPSTGPGLV